MSVACNTFILSFGPRREPGVDSELNGHSYFSNIDGAFSSLRLRHNIHPKPLYPMLGTVRMAELFERRNSLETVEYTRRAT